MQPGKQEGKGTHLHWIDLIKRCQLYRDSQTNVGWDENVCAAYDVIASEDHSYIATRWERSRNENSWKLVLNSEGANGSVDQPDDYKEAKKNCDWLYKEYAAAARNVKTRIHPRNQIRQRQEQQFERT